MAAGGLIMLISLLITALLILGPTEPARLAARPVAPLPEDLDAWLATGEAGVPQLRAKAAKRIVWSGEPGTRTPLALVYLHGFSASLEELRPVPDRLAEALGANLFFTRLAGHGRDGAAMAEPTMGDWMDDIAEALAIGRRLGQRVILMGTSTGGTLAALAAADPDLSNNVAGIILISPNFRINGIAGRVVEMPGVRHWGPLAVGQTRGFTPRSPGHGQHWTTEYPTVALAPLGALVHAARTADLAGITLPVLIVFSEEDTVVDPAATRAAAAAWGGPVTLAPVTLGPEDDPASHVLAGDILSPGQTEAMVRRLTAWVQALPVD